MRAPLWRAFDFHPARGGCQPTRTSQVIRPDGATQSRARGRNHTLLVELT